MESHQDLYLPCGVKCLTSLRQSMIIEKITLMALAQAKEDKQHGEMRPSPRPAVTSLHSSASLPCDAKLLFCRNQSAADAGRLR